MKNKIKIIFTLLAVSSANPLFAQKNLSEEINVIRPYKPILAEAIKINTNPEIKFEETGKDNPKYSFLSFRLDSSLKLNFIQSEKMKNESISKLYNTYVRVGGGNYQTSYAEAWVNNLRSKDWLFGAHYKHRAQAAKENRAYSENVLDGYAKRVFDKQSLTVSLMYDRDVNHFYGYDQALFDYEARAVRQQFDLVSLQTELKSNANALKNGAYAGNFDFYTVSDRFNAKENRFAVSALGRYKEFQMKAGIDIGSYEDSLKQDNNLLYFEPSIILKESGLTLNIGLSIYKESGVSNLTHFYPAVTANYDWEYLDAALFAGLTGKTRKNSFRDFYQVNPFLGRNQQLLNTNEKINLFAGMRGRIDAKNTYLGQVRYYKLAKEVYFVPNDDQYRTYKVIYDGNNSSQFDVVLNYSHQSNDKLRIDAGFEYSIFNTDTIAEAWHKPSTRFSIGTNYNIANKFLVDLQLFSYSTMKAPDVNGIARDIKGGVDLNFGLDYRYSKIISVYLNVNNILNYKREQFLYYNGYGFQALLGASFRF